MDDDICGQLARVRRQERKRKLTIDGCHDEADLSCVGSAGEMCVDLFRLVLVQADESVQDVVAGRRVVVAALVVGEVVLHWADWELLLESIDFVEEQDDGCLDEPPRVADRVEQREGLLHTVDGLVLEEQLIILGNGDQEQDSGNIFKAMNPLLSLRPLSSDIEHPICEVSNDESGLCDTSGLDTRSENVLVVRHVIGLRNPFDVVEVAAERILAVNQERFENVSPLRTHINHENRRRVHFKIQRQATYSNLRTVLPVLSDG